MDVTVEAVSKACCEALEAAGYMQSTISQYRKLFRLLEEHTEDGLLTEEAFLSFLQEKRPDGRAYERNYQLFRKRIVRLAKQYLESGSFDFSMVRTVSPQPKLVSLKLKKTLSDYQRSMEMRGLAKGTRDYYGRLAREFLLFLEAKGLPRVESAKAKDVLDFMADISKRWSGTSTYHLMSNFRPFLHWLKRDDLIDALSLARPSRQSSTVSVLKSEDEDTLALACTCGSVSSGDAAITLLALTCALRASDILNLRLSDIDWHSMTLSFLQKKTGNPVVVPMIFALAEALGNYILLERPDVEDDHVFLRKKAPHTPLSDHGAIYAVTKRVMAAAGLKGAGTRLLRHNAASRMLQTGSPLSVISAVLGHRDLASTDIYLETDEASMLGCVLPLPKAVIA